MLKRRFHVSVTVTQDLEVDSGDYEFSEDADILRESADGIFAEADYRLQRSSVKNACSNLQGV